MSKKSVAYVAREAGDEGEHLTFDDDPACYEVHRKAKPADLTLAAVVEMLDHDAENCNAHDFVGVHRKLAALLVKEVGRLGARNFMVQLVAYQGLHGLDGVAGCGDDELSAKLDSVEL